MRWSVPALVWLFLFSGGCSTGSATYPSGVERSRVIALLEGEEVLESEFESFLSRIEGEEDLLVEVVGGSLFREFILSRLLFREAHRAGVEVSEEEAWAALQNWTGLEEEPGAELLERCLEFLTVQRFIREKISPEVEVTVQEMLSYYENNHDRFSVGDQAHILEILLLDSVKAEEVRGHLSFGDFRGFREKARIYSQGVTAAKGGDLGVFERGELPEEFERFIFPLKPGEVSPVFYSSHGYHIFMVEEWIGGRNQRFFEVQKELFDLLASEKERELLQEFLKELLERVPVTILDPALQEEWRFNDVF